MKKKKRRVYQDGEKKVKFKSNEKCLNCERYIEKKCKGYEFSIKTKSFYCPKFKEK